MLTILGGAGFIGTRLCQQLAQRQIAFEIIDLKQSNSFPEKTKIADIRDYDALARAVTGDVIVNLAAVHRDDVRDPRAYYETNVDGVRNVVQLAEARGITRVVFTSTVAVYGFAEPGTGEDGEINPFNDYGRSKFQGEEVLRAWHAKDPEARALTIVRPTVVFGEGNRGNVYNLLKQISSGRFLMVGNGENRKSMAYVGNIAAFLMAACEQAQGYKVFNYVDKSDFDMNTLVSLVREKLLNKPGTGPRLPFWLSLFLGWIADGVARLTGRTFPISSIRVRKFCATTSFASASATLAGFIPPFSLAEGLERTLVSEFLRPDPNREVFFTE